MRVHIRPYSTKVDAKGRIKKVDRARKMGRGKGCLVLVEAAILSSGGQDRLKEAKETRERKPAVRAQTRTKPDLEVLLMSGRRERFLFKYNYYKIQVVKSLLLSRHSENTIRVTNCTH